MCNSVQSLIYSYYRCIILFRHICPLSFGQNYIFFFRNIIEGNRSFVYYINNNNKQLFCPFLFACLFIICETILNGDLLFPFISFSFSSVLRLLFRYFDKEYQLTIQHLVIAIRICSNFESIMQNRHNFLRLLLKFSLSVWFPIQNNKQKQKNRKIKNTVNFVSFFFHFFGNHS